MASSATGLFTRLGLSSVQVAAIQSAAIAQLTAGKVRMGYSVDGVSANYQFIQGMSLRSILDECADFLGIAPPIRRTVPNFNRRGTAFGTNYARSDYL